jgi:hypothetical protein
MGEVGQGQLICFDTSVPAKWLANESPRVGTGSVRALTQLVPAGQRQSKASSKSSLRAQILNWSRISGKAAARTARNAGVFGVRPQYPLSCTASRGSEQPKDGDGSNCCCCWTAVHVTVTCVLRPASMDEQGKQGTALSEFHVYCSVHIFAVPETLYFACVYIGQRHPIIWPRQLS